MHQSLIPLPTLLQQSILVLNIDCYLLALLMSLHFGELGYPILKRTLGIWWWCGCKNWTNMNFTKVGISYMLPACGRGIVTPSQKKVGPTYKYPTCCQPVDGDSYTLSKESRAYKQISYMLPACWRGIVTPSQTKVGPTNKYPTCCQPVDGG